MRSILLVLSALTALSSCDSVTDDSPSYPVDLTEEWTTASPSDVGVDPELLDRAVEQARDVDDLLSFLVVKDGRIVVEQYFNGNTRESLNDWRSVTKSVVSILTGIAIEENFVRTADQEIGDYIPLGMADMDDVQRSITIRHLLTMTSGIAWEEGPSYALYHECMSSDNPVRFLLDLPMEVEPGLDFTYNTPAVHLLSVVLEQATGMRVEEFAEEYLFDRIGIDRYDWERVGDGRANGGAGIKLRPRDAARLGQLFLQYGFSGTKLVIHPEWVTESTEPRFDWRVPFGPLTEISYGYLWWTEDGQADPVYLAWGYGGQFIYVVPEQRLVVVATALWEGKNKARADAQEMEILRVITGILPSALE